MSIKKLQGAFFVFLFFASIAHADGYSMHSGKFYELRESEEKIEFEFFNGTYSICENEKKLVPILAVNRDAAENSRTIPGADPHQVRNP